jgi:type II secretory pathway pseudopilin PulG
MYKQRGFTLVEVFLIVLILSIVGFAGYTVWNNNQKDNESLTFSQETSEEDESKIANETVSEDNKQRAWLTDYFIENCEISYATSTEEPFSDGGFSIFPFTSKSTLAKCKPIEGQVNYTLQDENIAIDVVIATNEILEYSGAPGDATWSTKLIDNADRGLTFSTFEKDDSNNKSCEQNPDTQVCGGGYGINVSFDHPNLNTVVNLIDYNEASDQKPNINQYERVLGSIAFPK